MSSLVRFCRRVLVLAVVVLAAGSILVPPVGAQDEDRVVDILQVSGTLDPPTAAAIGDLVRDANERRGELVVVQIDSPAGIRVAPAELVDVVRSSEVPVVIWVGPAGARAIGSAAFLVAASHAPAMSSRATLGPACPALVSRGCTPGEEELFAALVGEGEAEIRPDAVWTGEVAAAEGVALNAEGLEALLVELDHREVTTAAGTRQLDLRQETVTVRFHELGLIQRLLHASLDPTLVYLLVITALLLLLFEIFQPGFGVAGVAAALIAPLAIYGMWGLPVRWWAVVLIVVGLALLAIDLAIAGLGPPTVLGAAALAAGSWWLYAGDHPVTHVSGWLIALIVAFAVVFFVGIMTVVLRAQAGPGMGEVGEDLVGEVGVVRSAMNPEGHVFVSGALWRARWVGEQEGKIRAGTTVRVVDLDETTLLVGSADVEPDVARVGDDTPT